jgi:hypothetical protein
MFCHCRGHKKGIWWQRKFALSTHLTIDTYPVAISCRLTAVSQNGTKALKEFSHLLLKFVTFLVYTHLYSINSYKEFELQNNVCTLAEMNAYECCTNSHTTFVLLYMLGTKYLQFCR